MFVEELVFEPTPGFGKFYKPYLEHAVAHPAKMNMWLLEFLIRAFTKSGDVILDPMAGTGSTGVVAAFHGRNAVLVELEPKFYEWMEKARENVEKNTAIQQKGWIKNILGDARRLSKLLQEADVCITSPPFGDTYVGGGNAEKRRERLVKAGHDPEDFLGGKARNAVLKHYDEVDVCLTSPPYSESMTKKRKGYSVFPELQYAREMPQDSSDDNIANLPHGSIDLVLTSPPYADVEKCDRSRESWFNEDKEREKAGGSVTIQRGYRGSPENIGNLSLGNVDAVITSPPYGEAQEGSGIAKKGYQGCKHSPTDLVGERSYMPNKFENAENISRLPLGKIDTIITSPPYQNALHDSLEKREAWESRKLHDAKKGLPVGYSENADNIGNIKEHGSIDVILTSPPYADGKKAGEVKPDEVEKYAKRWEENVEKRDWNSWGKSFHTPGRLMGIKSLRDGYSNSKKNIGNLPFGHVDTIITSPPYSNIVKSKEGAINPHMQGLISKLSGIPLKDFAHNIEKLREAVKIAQSKIPFKYGDSPNNIGNLPLGNIDCCITSPPYEGSLEGTTRHTRGGIASRDPALAKTGSYATVMSFGMPVDYSINSENIGNMKRETYLEAMVKVYGEMFQVLKPRGLAIIVVKPFVRDKKPVDLPYHTWLLMEKVGFHLVKLYKFRLKQQSFWRILQYKKHPEVPVIAHEYVLVCEKPCSESSEVKPQISPLDFVVEMASREIALNMAQKFS